MRRVVVTGVGTITSAGRGVEALWSTVCSEQSCLTPIAAFDASAFECQVAGQVQAFNILEALTPLFEQAYPRKKPRDVFQQVDRCSHFALIAALDALEHAHLPLKFSPIVSPERVSLAVGTSMGGLVGCPISRKKNAITG